MHRLTVCTYEYRAEKVGLYKDHTERTIVAVEVVAAVFGTQHRPCVVVGRVGRVSIRGQSQVLLAAGDGVPDDESPL